MVYCNALPTVFIGPSRENCILLLPVICENILNKGLSRDVVRTGVEIPFFSEVLITLIVHEGVTAIRAPMPSS